MRARAAITGSIVGVGVLLPSVASAAPPATLSALVVVPRGAEGAAEGSWAVVGSSRIARMVACSVSSGVSR